MLARPCACEQTSLALSLAVPPAPPFLPQLCVLMSVVPFATSVCVTMVFFEVCYSQCGSQPSALEEDASNWASHEREERRQAPKCSPPYSFHKRSYGCGNKGGRVGASLILPSHRPASNALSAHLSGRPCRLCAFLSSVPSIGQVQSESLAELRLSLILSPKAASFI